MLSLDIRNLNSFGTKYGLVSFPLNFININIIKHNKLI